MLPPPPPPSNVDGVGAEVTPSGAGPTAVGASVGSTFPLPLGNESTAVGATEGTSAVSIAEGAAVGMTEASSGEWLVGERVRLSSTIGRDACADGVVGMWYQSAADAPYIYTSVTH